jgi:hypothetical protein
MITHNDALDALSKAASYDAAHTPRTSSLLIDAWIDHFTLYAPGVTRDHLLAAVSEYHREPRDRMLQPADLSAICRALRRDELDRTDPDDRPYRDVGGELPDYPAEWTSEQRLCGYWQAIRKRTYPATTDNWHTILATAA